MVSLFFVNETNAQISITSVGTAFTENFDGMGSSATATLPSGFKLGSDWATGRTKTILAAGTTGAGVISTSGSDYNFGNGLNASATDRAVGFLNSGTFASPDSIILKITNNTGGTISTINISFDYEQYRSGQRQFDWTFFHGTSSVPTTAVAAGGQSFAAGANNSTVFNPPTATSKSFTISGLSIGNGTDYYFRWTSAGLGGSSNGQAIGIDNFSLTVSAPPTVSSPTVSAITTNSALLGATVSSFGSAASISERGTVFKTSAGATITDNPLAEGNTTTGAFTQTRSLSPETRYYFKGYATSTVGTGFSPESDFYTLSNAPLVQATSLSATAFSASQIDLNWVSADFPTSGATEKRYLLLRATSPNVPVFTGTNGNAPTVDGNTTIVNQNISYLSQSASATGLDQSIEYNFLLIPYTWNGVSAATYNYLTASAPTATGNTSGSVAATLSSTVASSITNNSAVLGATIVSDGGDGIADRGTVYNTVSPVIISNNTLSEGGLDLGAFSHLRTDLLPQTKYYFAGYAVTNSGSLALSPESNFYTFSNPPVETASSLTATAATGSQINLSWTSAVFPTIGATFTGYILLRADYPNVPSITNGNGQAPVAGPNTTIVNAAIVGTATSAISSGLTGTSRYNYVLIPYSWNGVNEATYNYLITGAPSADATTFATAPAFNPSSLFFSNATCNSMKLTWRPVASATGYLVLQSSGSVAPDTNPLSGVVYSVGTTIGNATVAYIGANNLDTTFTAINLTDATNYNFRIYAFSGSNSSDISYNTSFPRSASVTTSIVPAPVAIASSAVGLAGFTANWNASTCASSYKLDVSTYPEFYNPAVAATTTASESFEGSLSLFTASGTGASFNAAYAFTGTSGYGVASGTNVITSANINTTNYINNSLTFKLAAIGGVDGPDGVKIEISPNGGTNWYTTLTIAGSSNASWTYAASGIATANYDGDTAVTALSANGFSYGTVIINNLPVTSQLKIRITLNTDGGSEVWTIDDLSVSGRTGAFASPYENFTVSGTTQAVSGLTNNTNYYYRVRGTGPNSTSNYSNVISTTTVAGYAELSTPTVTTITNNSAVLGATVINEGAASLTQRGTVYKTTTGVTATDNALAEGGTSLGAFSHVRTGLAPQTRYYFKGFATNIYGSGVSTESSFITLSNPPATEVTGLSGLPFSGDQIDLTWTAATLPASGATAMGYVVAYSLYPDVPSVTTTNGAAPTAGVNTNISALTANTFASVSSLAATTQYNFAVIPFTWNGIDSATINYYTNNIANTSATTFGAVSAFPPTNLTFSNVTCSTINVNWTNGIGADGVLVLRTSGGVAPNALPTGGVEYVAGATLGNATVAYVGTDSALVYTGLNDNTNFNFRLYSFTGSGATIAYLTGTPLSGSQATNAIAAPVATDATALTANSFTANWNSVACASNYNLYVYTNNPGNTIAAWTFPTTGLSAFTDSTVSNANNLGNNRFSVVPTTAITNIGGVTTQAASTNNWQTVGKYWQVIVNVTGYTNIKVSSVQYASGTGPKDFKIQYKIRANGTWTDVPGGTIVDSVNYTKGVVNNLALPIESDNIDSLYVRWITTSTVAVNGAAVQSGGTNRIDNIYFRGNQLQYATGFNGTSVSGTSANVTGLTAGSQYFYHVNAVGASASTTGISNIVSATTYNDIATADFRTKANGNFNDLSIWEYKYNATDYTNATALPSATNNVTIRAVDSVNMNVDFVINSGKTFIDSGKINMNGFAISGTGAFRLIAGATLYTANASGIYNASPLSGSIITTSRTFDGAANYVFNGNTAQTTAGLPATLTANLIFANTAGTTINTNRTVNTPGAVTVTGKLSFGTGIGSSAFSLNGSGSFVAQTGATLVITSTSGICAPATPNITDTLGSIRLTGSRTFASGVNYEFVRNDGSTRSFFGGSFGTEITSINNLTINNPRGAFLSNNNITVNGTLALTSGKLTTGSNKVSIASTGTLTKTDTTWVVGNLEKYITSGATTASYEIGYDTLNYTPATIAFNNVSTAGNLTATAILGTHPNLASSILSATKKLNFYTTLNGTVAFDSYNATIGFANPANIQGGANPLAFIAGNYNASWTYPSMGTLTSTSAQATGISNLGAIVIAEAGCAIVASASSNTPVCSGSDIQLSGSATGANGAVAYTWSGPASFTSASQNPVINNASSINSGVYTLTTTDALGCVSTATATVVVNALPIAGITNNTGVTELTCTTTSISVIATGGDSYSWDNGLGNAATASITSAGTYTVTVTAANGCTSTASIVVTSNTTAPTAGITNNTGVTELTCTTTSISVTATGGDSYSWDNGLGNAATASITSAGTYTVTATSANGCTSTASITVTSNTTAPTADITNNTGVTELTCTTTSISVTATGGDSYSWDNGLGNAATTSITSAGTYTVTATSANGCTSTASITVTSNTTAPTANITNNTGVTELTCTTTSISVTATGGDSYSWDNGLGNEASANITSAGTYTVTATNANGCTATASITITSNTTAPTAGITNNTGVTQLTCSVTSISVTATGGESYSWNNNLGNNATASIVDPGTYTVTVTGANGCSSTSSIIITQSAGVPTVDYTASATTVCAGTSVTLSGTGADNYSWTGGISNGVSFVPTSTTTYTVTGTNTTSGCSNTASVTITVNPLPTGAISGTTSICNGGSANLSIEVTGNGPWAGTLSDGTSFSGSTSPISVAVSPVSSTTYTLSSLSASSCAATDLTGSAIVAINNFIVDTIVGSRNSCIYTGTSTLDATYSISASNASSYVWTVPTGATIISGAGTNTISVHFATTFTTGTISVVVSSLCGSPITKTATITKTLSAAPASVTGPTSVCAYIGTSTEATYTAASVNGAIKYSWTLPSTVTIVSATSDSSSINVTFGVAYVTTTFSVKAVVGCGTTSARTLSVTGTTTAPVAGTPQTRCGAGLVTFSATPGAGETIDWYSASAAGTLLRSGSPTFDSTYTSTGVKTVYAVSRSTSNGCISATRTAVTATLNALPSVVTITVSGSSCGANTVTLSATAPAGTTLDWFADSSVTGTVLATGTSFTTPVLSSTTKYFVASKSAAGCYSLSLKAATATINAVPGLPTVNTTQSRCGTGSIVLTATAPTGSAVWFRNEVGGTALTTGTTATVTYTTPITSVSDSTYYVASKSTSGCFSERTAVLAQVITAVSAPVAVGASRCGAGAITIGATPGAGETINWYSAATAGILIRSNSLTLDTSLTTATRTFYAAAINTSTGCISATRTAVVATFNALPTAVTVSVNASSCGANAVTLSATAPSNTTLNWFADSSTTGTVLATGTSFTTPVLSSTTKYFVASRSAAGCYSVSLKAATATINAVPELPIVNTTQSRCGTGSIVLTATAPTGSAVWFRNEVGGTALTTGTTATVTYTTPLTSAADSTYYVASKSTSGCFSARTAVLAQVITSVSAPVAVGASRCGAGAITIGATPGAGETINWYSAATAGILIRSNSLTLDTSLTTATRTFYAAAINTTTGCISATRTAVVATFNALPKAVTVSVNASSCGTNAITLSATAPAGTTLDWFADSSVTGTVLATGTSFTTPVLSSTTKYFVASKSAAGCYSLSLKAATATINAVPGLPTVNTTQSRCGTGAIVLTATAPTGSAVWFRNEVGGTALTSSTTATVNYTTPATSAADSTYYVATKATTGCFSARTAVLAKINSLPSAPTTTGTSICGAGRATVSASTTAIDGTIDWYSATTAGTLLRSNSLTFDSLITATRTFFALARVTTTGCVSTRTAAIATVNPLLAAPTTLTGTTSICPIVGTANGATYTATAVTNAVSYQWTIPVGAVIDSGSNGLKIKVRFITAGLNDSIFVQAVAATGCAGAKKVLKLVTTGCGAPIAKAVASKVEDMNVNVFPNPTTSNFNVQVITADKETIKARILDMQGRQIRTLTINPYETNNIGAELKAGSYIIEVRQGKNIKTTRILKF